MSPADYKTMRLMVQWLRIQDTAIPWGRMTLAQPVPRTLTNHPHHDALAATFLAISTAFQLDFPVSDVDRSTDS